MLNRDTNEIQHLLDFLQAPTPKAWLIHAAHNIPLLLIDHAHCERKAAATALNLMSKYPDKKELVALMSPLAREELLHFEKVITLMEARSIDFGPLPPSNYAAKMHRYATKADTVQRLCDLLIIGAIIEARSCERFHALAPYIEDVELAKFYKSLLKAEARHFENYLQLAKSYGRDISERVAFFLKIENKLITSEDNVFRFHSGIPPL